MNSLMITDKERSQYDQPLTVDEVILLDHCVLTQMSRMSQDGIPDEELFIKARILNMKLSKMMEGMSKNV